MWLYICGQVLGGRAWPRRRRSVARVSAGVSPTGTRASGPPGR